MATREGAHPGDSVTVCTFEACHWGVGGYHCARGGGWGGGGGNGF